MHPDLPCGSTPCEHFLALRRTGDSATLANDTLKSPLFKQMMERVAAFLLGRLAPAARSEIEGNATTAIGLRLWRTCGADFRCGDDDSFEAYLYGTCLKNVRWARSAWLRSHGSAGRAGALPDFRLDHDYEIPSEEIPEGLFVRASKLVETTIPTLPTHLQTAVIHLLEGRSLHETAQELHCCTKTVLSYRQQALDRLREALERDCLF
jgi:DNA-directed RNA polymerase specialized sigma24 family protein